VSDTKAGTRSAVGRKAASKVVPSAKFRPVEIAAEKATGASIATGVILTTRRTSSGQRHLYVLYVRSKGVDEFVTSVHEADPMQLIETERRGVASVFVKDLSRRMEIPAQRMFAMLGVPKATAEKKVAAGDLLAGSGGRAALGLARLLGIAREIVENSTAPEAKEFDTAKWLGQWLEKPQPALGGRKPAELIETPTGLEVVAKLLGAIQSGAYQ
jgi:putative toxin-antitoxin system antitoxin component (TIGR02293 family)